MLTGHLAWIECEGRWYWARQGATLSPDRVHECDLAVNRLVAGVYEHDSRWARRIVRNRIRTTEALRESSWGLIKVAARRVDFSVPVDAIPQELFSGSGIEVAPKPDTRDEWLCGNNEEWNRPVLSAHDAWSLLEHRIDSALQWERTSGQRVVALPVAAVLVDATGTVLSWGINSAWDLRTQHAETNLIYRWRRMGSPGTPARLWVTRKPCKMCAGWIWDALCSFNGAAPLSVEFRDPDDGPMAKMTVLDPGSFENTRAMNKTFASREDEALKCIWRN